MQATARHGIVHHALGKVHTVDGAGELDRAHALPFVQLAFHIGAQALESRIAYRRKSDGFLAQVFAQLVNGLLQHLGFVQAFAQALPCS